MYSVQILSSLGKLLIDSSSLANQRADICQTTRKGILTNFPEHFAVFPCHQLLINFCFVVVVVAVVNIKCQSIKNGKVENMNESIFPFQII